MKSWTGIRVALAASALVVALAGTGSPQPLVAQDGPLVFCSDVAFPPMEFFEGSDPVGADIDIANEVGKRLGREVQITNVGFDGIIAALQSGTCDAIISGMNNTPERAKQVDFVDYLNVGQSLVVKTGNPLGISDLESLCGQTAGAQVGTTNLDTLDKASTDCQAAGKDPVDVVGFRSDADAVLALKTDRIDVYETDSSVAAYYIAQDPESFQFAGPAIGAIPVGIALRKDSTELRDQIQGAIEAMYADGTMTTILEKWNLQDFALPGAGAATPVASPVAG
jgi:polar amino acid transport system substrate-binding protein